MKLASWVVAVCLVFTGVSWAEEREPETKQPENLAQVGEQMKSLAGSLAGLPELPKLDQTIVIMPETGFPGEAKDLLNSELLKQKKEKSHDE